MLIAIILALTAITQAAAISKLIQQPPSVGPVSNRSSIFGHNFALVCVYDRDATNFCQKHFGYGCDASGKQRTVIYNEHCEVLCQCIDLAPKPACMVGLTGSSWCLRAVNQEITVQGTEHDQEVLTTTETPPALPFATTTDLAFSKLPPSPVSSSLTAPDEFLRVLLAANFKPSTVAQKTNQFEDLVSPNSHQWAMICTEEHATTTGCSSNGYYCDFTSIVRASTRLDQHCTDTCICVDRHSKTLCFIDKNGIFKCDEGGIKEEAVVRHLVSTSPMKHSVIPRDDNDATQIPHNFAMVCASDKQETIY